MRIAPNASDLLIGTLLPIVMPIDLFTADAYARMELAWTFDATRLGAPGVNATDVLARGADAKNQQAYYLLSSLFSALR